MLYEEDINMAHDMKSICRAALLKANGAGLGTLSDMSSNPLGSNYF